MSRTPVLLDASALLAWLNLEPGAERVEAVLDTAAISTVNLAEVASKLYAAGLDRDGVVTALDLGIERVPFDWEAAHMAGSLLPLTSRLGLSLGDRCCLATAFLRKIRVLTADRQWRKLRLAGVELEYLR